MHSSPEGLGSRGAVPREAQAEVLVLEDLATLLAADQALYLRLGPEGAVMSVKGRESFAFGDAIGPRWYAMTPEERAEALVAWIRKAAKYCRKPRLRWLPA